ncbi:MULTISPECIES: cation:proton antiporter [unclassified Agrococcus]|uniref:cation:proton antiporter n=1 Tax=unclassified Agrococcus TaxID=2615065 RepID=UPI00360CFD5E
MTADLAYLILGVALLIAVVLPVALRRVALSAPVVLLAVGCLVGLLPVWEDETFSPIVHGDVTEHLTEATVLVSLMGVGLALDRPLSLRRLGDWRRWSATWRLLAITMPLCIGAVALLGWWWMGLALPAALLLGAALAPTDPVLASDVQVEGPGQPSESTGEIDESDEVRFALTSEAGLNDALAFPFVYAAILLAGQAAVSEWIGAWVGFYLVAKVLIGVAIGVGVGWLLGRIAFRSSRESMRVADRGQPLMAVVALLLAYGVAEVAQGYGFVAVFVAALTLRSVERGHDYHRQMHATIERLEQLLTLVVLLLLGISLTNGLLADLTPGGIAVGIALVLVIRPVTGWIALAVGRRRPTSGDRPLRGRERLAVGFFGVRGIGSIFYVAYAAGEAGFAELPALWSTVGFTITLSVIVHGISATPIMRRVGAEA